MLGVWFGVFGSDGLGVQFGTTGPRLAGHGSAGCGDGWGSWNDLSCVGSFGRIPAPIGGASVIVPLTPPRAASRIGRLEPRAAEVERREVVEGNAPGIVGFNA